MKRVPLVCWPLVVFLMGNEDCNSAEDRDRAAVNDQQEQYTIAQPIPKFDWSLERTVVIQLYQTRNKNVNTWSVWRSDYGMVLGDCPSVGYPIPYDTSLTNPLQEHGPRGAVIEMPEPNGVFPSKNSNATWVRCIVEVMDERVEAPIYIEDRVTAYPYPVLVDYEHNRVTPVGGTKPTVTVSGER